MHVSVQVRAPARPTGKPPYLCDQRHEGRSQQRLQYQVGLLTCDFIVVGG